MRSSSARPEAGPADLRRDIPKRSDHLCRFKANAIEGERVRQHERRNMGPFVRIAAKQRGCRPRHKDRMVPTDDADRRPIRTLFLAGSCSACDYTGRPISAVRRHKAQLEPLLRRRRHRVAAKRRPSQSQARRASGCRAIGQHPSPDPRSCFREESRPRKTLCPMKQAEGAQMLLAFLQSGPHRRFVNDRIDHDDRLSVGLVGQIDQAMLQTAYAAKVRACSSAYSRAPG